MHRIMTLLLCCSMLTMYAQQELLLNALTSLPQASATNPGIPPDMRGWSIGLPSLAFNYGNNAFAFNDLVKKYSSDSAVLDVDNILSKLQKDNVIHYQINADVFRLLWSRERWFLSILMTEKMNVKFSYTKELPELFWYGNSRFLGDTLSIGPKLNAVYYREFSAGGGYTFGKVTVGMRAKLLAGLASVTTEEGNLNFFTDATDYSLYVSSSYRINTSGTQNFQKDPWQASFNFNNPGYAIDLGFYADVTSNISIQGSVNNLGVIRWRDDVMNHRVEGTYSFKGLDLREYFNADTFDVSGLLDTLRTTFSPERDSTFFSSALVPRSYLNVRWSADKTTIGMMTFIEFFDRLRPAINFYTAYRFFPFLETAVSVSWKNKRWENFGFSVIGDIRNVQIYAITDNIGGIISPRNSKNVNFRFGINVRIPDQPSPR